MLCAISGEAPQVPVVSRKSGHLFEKRLIEAHIKEHHTDPVNGEDLEVDDLLELKSTRTLKPRPPTLTSIPALLSAFQNEWDAIALETYNLRKELSQTRQELSTALYQHDAATRVIARLVKERDEARDALSKVTVSAGGASNGDAMQVDNQALPEDLAEVVTTTQASLSSSRKKRPIPNGWLTPDDVQSFDSTQASDSLAPESRALAIDESGELAIVGSADGIAQVYAIGQQKVVQSIKVGTPVTTALWWGERQVVATTSGSTQIFENGAAVGALGSHAGAVTALALHPSGSIIATGGIDKTIKFHNSSTLGTASQIYADAEITCGVFHPDGHLFGAGGKDGKIRLFDIVSGSIGAEFVTEGPVQSLVFSENGYWLASSSKGATGASIWDLRRLNDAPKVLEIGGPVADLAWDYSAQFLAVAGASCVAVQQWSKKSKSWSEPFRKAVPAQKVRWGADAKALITLTEDDRVSVFGVPA